MRGRLYFGGCVIILFIFTFGPRAVNAYLIKWGGGLIVCPESGSIIFYHPRERKRIAKNGRSKSVKSHSTLRRVMPPHGEWGSQLQKLLKAYKRFRDDDAAVKSRAVPAEFFVLPGETTRKDKDANQDVTKWLKEILLTIPGALADMCFDEKLSSHSLREGAASAFHHLRGGDLPFLKWWFGWSDESNVPETAYIKCHHWGNEETAAARFFFIALKEPGWVEKAKKEKLELEKEASCSRG